jgi:hypothetical protein
MHVQVKHALPGIHPRIDDQSVSTRVNTLASRNVARHGGHPIQQSSVNVLKFVE